MQPWAGQQWEEMTQGEGGVNGSPEVSMAGP